jgi:Ca-activated chloride channel family protein
LPCFEPKSFEKPAQIISYTFPIFFELKNILLFRFEHPSFLYALLLVPLIILFWFLMARRKKALFARMGNTDTLKRLIPDDEPYKHNLKFGLWIVAFMAILIALANPQIGNKKERVKRKSVDVILALDVSRSMMAQDIVPNRLERAKQFSVRLIDELKGNRIGTVVFAGNAYLQMPLTIDYATASVFIKSANCEMTPVQGTAIGEAVAKAVEAYPKDSKTHKALIIVTDGEDHDSDATAAVRKAANAGVLIFTVGVGGLKSVPIPEITEDGVTRFKIDESGKQIATKLNETALKDLAEAGNGAYFNIATSNNDDVATALRKSVDELEKSEFETRMFSSYESYYQYFVLFALICLLLDSYISFRKNKWIDERDIFNI